jgi:mRNA interferase MazF
MGKVPLAGDVFWIAPERLNPCVPGQPHPHLVVQSDALNRSRISTVVVCGLSSQLSKGTEPGNVTLEDGEAGLAMRSVVIVSQVSTVEKSSLGEHVGTLSEDRVRQVLEGLAFQQRSFFGR